MSSLSVFEPKRLWKWRDAPISSPPRLRKIMLPRHEALVVSKSQAGFDRTSVETISTVLRSISEGEYGALKFLIFDFAHADSTSGAAADGFAELVAANARLIVDTPVITLAWARSLMRGPDFDFAMHCAAIVAERGASFSMEGDPYDLFGLYAALGRRIGFVKAQRLIERDPMLSAEDARELLIVKDVVAPQPGQEAIETYLAQFGRRHNAAHAIFRAQRLAQPPVDRAAFEAANRR